MEMKILVTPTSLQPGRKSKALERLRDFSEELVFNDKSRPLTEEELIPLLKGCQGYLAGLDFITERVLREAEDLKVISRYGTGYDRIDMAAASQYGVTVTNTPGVNAQAVGELAVGLLLSVARQISYLDRTTRSGEWVRAEGVELKGKTLGILGLGAIGKVVARCAKGFGMRVAASDPFIDREYCREHGIEAMDMEDLLSFADAVSLHLPLNKETTHLIGKEALARMKDGVILINTSRGGIIDEEAAYCGLKSGKIGGLGLDAFENEPPKGSSLFEFSNVVATPHTGAHTKEAASMMAERAVDNLISVLQGERCPYIVGQST